MLKLVSALWDLDASPPRFIADFSLLSSCYRTAPKKVKMVEIERALSFSDRSWKFLGDPFSPASRAVYDNEPLEVPPP